MKTKVRRLSRRSFSALLALLMMISTLGVGSLITVNAFDTVGIHTNATISGNWATTNLSTTDGNHYTGNIYFKGKASGNYEMGMKVAGNWKVFGGYWINSGTTYNDAWGSGGSDNDQIVPTTTTTTTYIKGAVDFYKEYSGNPRLVITQTALSALKTTVTVGSSTLTSGETTTIGKNNSGGSGSYSNTYKVRQGSSTGTDVTSSVLSGTTFTAPEVTTATTYYVTTTVTDSNTSATTTSTEETITVNPKTYNITFSQPTNGSIKVNNSTSSPVSIVKGNSVSLVITPSSGYKIKTLTDNGSAVSAAVGKTTAYTYTISNVTAAHTIAATMEAANTPLSAPTNVKLDGKASDCAVDATTVGAKIRLSWNSVNNAGSYKIYKGGTLVDTVTTLYYDIERASSYSGSYTVTAYPSNTNLYSESAASTARTLTVKKQKLNAPTVTVSPTDIKSGDSVSLTATNTNSAYTAAQFNYYYYESSLTVSDTYKLTAGTAKSIELTSTSAPGTKTYKVVAYPVNGTSNDYYTQSDAASADTVSIYKAPDYRIIGESYFIGSSSWAYANGKSFDHYTSNGIYYFATKSVSNGDHYFRLCNSSAQFSGDNSTSTDFAVTLDTQYSLVQNNTKAFKVSGSGVFMIFFDVISNKIWVSQNTWTVTPHVYYQSYNLGTDSYNPVAEGTTGGTISPDSETLVNKNDSTTLTATPASGYTFDGWYTSTDFTTATRVSTDASYTFTPSASGDYYALFKETAPAHYTLSVASVANATVKATYNGTTLQEGSGSKSVPVGATVTVSITLSTGYKLDSTTPSGLTTGSSTFTMPTSNTAVNATVSKIQYALTAVVSPNYGTLKFYSNSGCTTEITTATYQQTFYAKYTPPSAYYARNNITCTSGSATRSAISGNKATFQMGAGAATITATVKAAKPTFGTCSGMTVYANESFTYAGATLATLPNSTLSYTFQGTTNTTGVFTAPTTADRALPGYEASKIYSQQPLPRQRL